MTETCRTCKRFANGDWWCKKYMMPKNGNRRPMHFDCYKADKKKVKRYDYE